MWAPDNVVAPVARPDRSGWLGIVFFAKGWPVSGSVIVVEKTPRLCARVGTVLIRVSPVRSRVPCQSTKKNVLFF